jgi:hypothetical protein
MSYTTCPSCGGSEGQGCYSYCPIMLQTRVMELERQIEEYYLPLTTPRHHEGREKSVAALAARVRDLDAEVAWHKYASARRGEVGAALLRRVAELKAALQWIDQQRYADRSTITPDNAFERAISLNDQLVMIMDKARAVLNLTTQEK